MRNWSPQAQYFYTLQTCAYPLHLLLSPALTHFLGLAAQLLSMQYEEDDDDMNFNGSVREHAACVHLILCAQTQLRWHQDRCAFGVLFLVLLGLGVDTQHTQEQMLTFPAGGNSILTNELCLFCFVCVVVVCRMMPTALDRAEVQEFTENEGIDYAFGRLRKHWILC